MDNGVTAPDALVEIISVLRKTAEIKESEIGTARRPFVRSRFAQVIEAGPDELAGYPRRVLQGDLLLLRVRGPRRNKPVVV